MNTTDIPNGCVFRGNAKHNVLMDYDDNGHLLESSLTNVHISGWSDILDNGLLKPNVFVLVHVVKGEQQILVRRLHDIRMMYEDQTVAISSVYNAGLMKNFANNIYKQFMLTILKLEKDEAEAKCKKKRRKTDARL